MTAKPATKELVVLVADKNMEAAFLTLLRQRQQSLGIRPIEIDVYNHPRNDPGCYLESHEFLRPLQKLYDYAMVAFDCEGCGSSQTRKELEHEVEARLSSAGWKGRCCVLVLDPELEIWVWSDSPQVDQAIGWRGRESLREWLEQRGFLQAGDVKPGRPKEAVEAALREMGKPRSSSIYAKLAESVGLGRCSDLSFTRFRETVRQWFPPS
jgi:hypothetical protein